jgi:hypothetical protein
MLRFSRVFDIPIFSVAIFNVAIFDVPISKRFPGRSFHRSRKIARSASSARGRHLLRACQTGYASCDDAIQS